MSVQARPQDYAAAIYELAFEHWTEQLGQVRIVLQRDPSLRATLDAAGTSMQDKLQRLEQAMPEQLDRQVRSFLGTLLEAGQIDQLDAILVEFERMVTRREEHQLALVTTAVALAGDEEQSLRAKLTERFGADLEFEFKVDPSLIGGVYVRVGDKVIDGSVAGKLAALRDRLAA